MITEAALRRLLIDTGATIHRRGLTHGRTGNLSVRTATGCLVTPTGRSLGDLQADELSLLDLDGRHRAGPSPTKEAFLHLAILRSRPDVGAVVHTHSTAATAVSCLHDLDPVAAIPPLTAYFAMRVGAVALLPYARPGDPALESVITEVAGTHSALLLRNHGPVVAGPDLPTALDALEELEHAAEIFLRLAPFQDRIGLAGIPASNQETMA
ncbi:class II aldolase/adducin family protein [Microlunatus sp. GCM10028923]|uniref:class II aldolase/adducin family protein n=1 Tax=Microlunatus sp. GCM10028923 TaxID=3273400 RepID=UPI003617702A